jgi:hypothetical protein
MNLKKFMIKNFIINLIKHKWRNSIINKGCDSLHQYLHQHKNNEWQVQRLNTDFLNNISGLMRR